MIAYLKGVRQYNQGKTDRNVEIIAKYTEMTPEEVKGSCWMSMRSDGIDRYLRHEQVRGMGFRQRAFGKTCPARQLLDMSFVESANAALK